MGDLLRQACKKLWSAAVKMALPTLVLTMLLLLRLRPTADDLHYTSTIILMMLMMHLTLTLTCYFFWLSNRKYRIERLDGEIVGKCFGGMRKIDRTFCTALQLLVEDNVMEALDLFLTLPMDELSPQERNVLHFYLGRSYQLSGCPSNAVQHYNEARAAGFDSVYLLLFLARSHTDAGAYDEALRVYESLLERNPQEFSCVRTDIGMMYLRKHDGEQALHWFQDSVEQGENLSFALGGCSLAFLLLGDAKESQSYYEQAVTNHMSDLEGFRVFRKELEDVVALRQNQVAKEEL